MRPVLDRHPEVVEGAEEAIRRAGVEPVHTIIRGGTDGARLTEKGLPTPNIFTGGQHYHSVREWASVQDMGAAAATAVELVAALGRARAATPLGVVIPSPRGYAVRASHRRPGRLRRSG